MRINIPPTGAREAFGPYRTYCLSRGLSLHFNAEAAVVKGGAGSAVTFPFLAEPNEFGLLPPGEYAKMVDRVERDFGVRLVGVGDGSSSDAMFRVDEFAISGKWLAEALLGKFIKLESLIWGRIKDLPGIDETALQITREFVARLNDDISYGKLGPDVLQEIIELWVSSNSPIKEAFFASNATSIAEDIRATILAACHHFGTLTSGVLSINDQGRPERPHSNGSENSWEIRHWSGGVDALAFSYTSAIVACYTSLDLLYELFVYLTREPLGNPAFPTDLHFPDAPDSRIFQSGGRALPEDLPKDVLPHAIPNLEPGDFASLRHSRNAFVHRMAPDMLRPRVYVGFGLPPVNNQPLQYVQYLSRDIDANGKPAIHPWSHRFYENQTDAQDSLFEWIERTWQCIFDTTEWLINRLGR